MNSACRSPVAMRSLAAKRASGRLARPFEPVGDLADLERPADEGDTLPARLYEVLDGHDSPGDIVDRDGAERGVRAGAVDEHSTDAAVAQSTQARLDIAER
jgi:hypothetical protein